MNTHVVLLRRMGFILRCFPSGHLYQSACDQRGTLGLAVVFWEFLWQHLLPGMAWFLLGACAAPCRDTVDGREVPVHLVHVPKCGGTSIHEFVDGRQWYHGPKNYHVWEHVKFTYRGLTVQHPGTNYSGNFAVYLLGPQGLCSAHHIPPKNIAQDSPVNPYCDPRKNFVVTRHPMERLRSQWLYMVNMGMIRVASCAAMNGYILERLKTFARGFYTLDDCHYIPASDYVLDDTGRVLVDNILRLHHLEEDLGRLLGEQISLPSRKSRHTLSERVRRMMHCRWRRATVALAERVYKRDYLFFNYTLTTTSSRNWET